MAATISENDEPDPPGVKWALDQIKLLGDKSYSLDEIRMLDETPKIENAEQYLAYKAAAEKLNATWRAKGDEAFSAFCRSHDGMLANALSVRMIQWEDENA